MLAKIPTYIFLGQSNMDGRGYWPTRPTYGQNGTLAPTYALAGGNADAQVFYKTAFSSGDNGSWQNLDEFDNNANPIDVGNEVFGPEMAFMKEMADFKGNKVALIKCARGGSGVNVDMVNAQSWHVPSNGLCYTLAVEYIQQGLEKLSYQGMPEVKALVWYQGWSDSDTDQHVTDYQVNMVATLDKMRDELTLRSDVFANTKFYIVQSPQKWVTAGSRTSLRYNGLEAAKTAAVAADNNMEYIPEPVGGYSLFTDNTHLTGDDYSQLGVDLFNSLKLL